MANTEIRNAISNAGLRHWQVADAAGISEATLCVWLRKPLSDEREKRVNDAINLLKAGDRGES